MPDLPKAAFPRGTKRRTLTTSAPPDATLQPTRQMDPQHVAGRITLAPGWVKIRKRMAFGADRDSERVTVSPRSCRAFLSFRIASVARSASGVRSPPSTYSRKRLPASAFAVWTSLASRKAAATCRSFSAPTRASVITDNSRRAIISTLRLLRSSPGIIRPSGRELPILMLAAPRDRPADR